LPSQEEHLQKADRNEQFAVFLADKTTYYDWAATVLFYAALHYMDAILAAAMDHPKTHDKRHSSIRKNGTLRRVYAEYRALESLSRNARYYAVKIEAGDVHIARQQYYALKAHIRKSLGL
jgi:hypothetical protein